MHFAYIFIKIVLLGIYSSELVSFHLKNAIFVADGINSVGDYNSPPGGCRLCVCLCVCVSVCVC